jgi:uncharacterized protein YjiS (DUF1127 family)
MSTTHPSGYREQFRVGSRYSRGRVKSQHLSLRTSPRELAAEHGSALHNAQRIWRRWLASVAEAIATIVTRRYHEHRIRRTVQILAELDDHMLLDVGISSRSTIEQSIREGSDHDRS